MIIGIINIFSVSVTVKYVPFKFCEMRGVDDFYIRTMKTKNYGCVKTDEIKEILRK